MRARLLRHPATFFRAFTASISTPLAMIHLMLRAFCTAGLAYLSAHAADCLRELTASCHISCRQTTYLRTIQVQPDTSGHILNVLLA